MTYEIKYRKEEEMKDSGIGWLGKVPREWGITRIKYISDLIMGQSPDSNEVNQNGLGIPFLQGKAEFGEKHPQAINYCIKPKKNSEIDDILISVRAPVGELNISDVSYCIGRGLAAIRGNSNNNKYLFYSLLSYKDALVSYATGTTFESVSISQIKNLTTLKVDFIDQQKITNFLDLKTSEFDSIISKKEKLIQKLEEAKKSLISEVVTGKVKIVDGEIVERKSEEMKDSGVEWLGMIPKDWEVKRLKYLINEPLKYGANESGDEDNPNNPRYIRITDFGNDGRLKTSGFKSLEPNKANEYMLKDGDILFARSGATVGKTFQFKDYSGEACFAGYLIKAVPDQSIITSDFLYCFTRTYAYENWKNSIFIQATIQNIGADKYKDFKLSKPGLKEQKLIYNYLNDKAIKVDQVIIKTKLQIQKLKLAKQSLISEAITGKIDLSDWEII